ncbi:MAG: hypothetical protein ABJA98_10120 [Acidobacteriota bacterium]
MEHRDSLIAVSAQEVFIIRLSSGRALKVRDGTTVAAEEFVELGSHGTDKAFAEVTGHPTNPSILGLKNLCRNAWSAPAPEGGRRKIEPGKTVKLESGLRIDFGPLAGTVRDGQSGFVLSTPAGSGILLKAGRRLTARDVMGMRSGRPGAPAAQVAGRPNDPALLGLKNLTDHAWSATVPGGVAHRVEPGKTIKLAPGTTIDFGFLRGEIQGAPAWGGIGVQGWIPKMSLPPTRRGVATGIALAVLVPLLAVGWYALRSGESALPGSTGSSGLPDSRPLPTRASGRGYLGISAEDEAAVPRLDPAETARHAEILKAEYARLPPAPSLRPDP